MIRFTRALVGVALAVIVCVAGASAASAASIVVNPSSVPAGGQVHLSGDVLAPGGQPGCTAPGPVTLISHAFTGLGEFAGEGAVNLNVDASGHFSQTVTLSSTVTPGTYDVTGRCGGGNLGVTASITVVLPVTGAPSRTTSMALVGLLVTVAGVLALTLARRRVRPTV
jgi:LPXTG-motif cell wall-anchored protein